MALSILNNIPAMQAEDQLSQTNSALQTTLYRLASGSKLNSGADDAAGLSIANGLSANVAALTQSSANASNGIGLLQTADGALSQVTSLLNRAVTLATEASTSTINSTQAQSLNTEFSSIMSEIDRIGQKTSFNDQNVFGSTSGGNGSWTFGTAVADPTANFAVGGETISITDTGTGNSQTFTTTNAMSLNDLVASINTTAATAATKMNVTASVSAAGKLVLTDTSGANSIVAVAGGTTTDLGTVSVGQNTVTDSNTWQSTNATALTSTTALTGGSTMTIVDSDTGSSVDVTIAANETVATLINDINTNYAGTAAGKVNVTATLTAAGKLEISDNSGNGSIYMSTTDTSLASMTDSLASAGGTSQVYLGDGTTTTAANTISTSIASLSATQLGLTADLKTTSGAQTALTQITSAIASVAQQRGTIGASINRLTAATNVIKTQIQNLSSAQNNISAADISTEVSNMTKYNVLTQTGISALSQSNQMQQALLKLLQ